MRRGILHVKKRETGVRQMRRGDVPIHLALCLLQTVKCPYWDYGCEWEMQRGQLDLHERESMHTHFKLADKLGLYTKCTLRDPRVYQSSVNVCLYKYETNKLRIVFLIFGSELIMVQPDQIYCDKFIRQN